MMIFYNRIKTDFQLFVNRPIARKYLSNSGYLVFGQAINMVILTVVGAIVARYFGPSLYGYMSYAYSLIGLLSAIGALGMDAIVIKELVEQRFRPSLIFTAFLLRLVFAFLLYMGLAIITFLHESDSLTRYLLVLLGSGLIFRSFETFALYFQAKSEVLGISVIKLSVALVFSLFKLLALYYGVDIYAFAIVILLEIVTLGIVYFGHFRKKTMPLSRGQVFSRIDAKKIIWQSLPIFISGIMVSIYMRIDQIMIQNYLGAEQTGIYAASVKISEMWYFIPMLLVQAVTPSLIETYKNNREKYYKRLSQLLGFLFYISLAAAIALTIFGSFIISVLFGSAYHEATLPLAISAWAAIFVFWGVGISNLIILDNTQHYSTINTTIGAIINVSLNSVLIPIFGIAGAATSTLISYAYSACFGYYFFTKTRKYATLQLISPIHAVKGLLSKGNII
jgi:O-antigen/teichoic acid export membrane protein